MRQDVDTSSSGHTSPEVQVSYVNPVMVVKAKSVCVNANGAGWARFNHASVGILAGPA